MENMENKFNKEAKEKRLEEVKARIEELYPMKREVDSEDELEYEGMCEERDALEKELEEVK